VPLQRGATSLSPGELGGIRGEHVVQAVDQVATRRGAPELIRVGNGPEFVSKVLDRWAYERGVTLDFSRP
jgi:putative transposase